MKAFKVIFIIWLFSILSCKSTISVQNHQNRMGDVFTLNQIAHFPCNSNYPMISKSYLHPYNDSKYNKGAYLKEIYTLPQEDISTLENELKSSAILVSKHNDSLVLKIDRQETKVVRNNENSGLKVFPFPTFIEEMLFYEIEDFDSLPDDFILYLLEAKEGMLLGEKLCTELPNMPNEWKHGMSRGIAISKARSQIIYWIDIW